MSEAVIAEIGSRYKHVHDAALKLVEDLTEEQMRHQVNASTPNIAFHLWHMRRYADSVDRHLNGSGLQEMWERDRLAQRWGFDPEVLGTHGTGTGMESDALAALTWPPKSDIEAYAQQSFASAEKALKADARTPSRPRNMGRDHCICGPDASGPRKPTHGNDRVPPRGS